MGRTLCTMSLCYSREETNVVGANEECCTVQRGLPECFEVLKLQRKRIPGFCTDGFEPLVVNYL